MNIVEFAAERGLTVGAGQDDWAVFRAALDEHDTVYVPIGRYVFSETLELGPRNNLIGLHPRQTWLVIPDEAPGFDDPEQPRAIIGTPSGGRNFVAGLGLDTDRNNPGALQVHWGSGRQSHLSDITTQFVKWAPEETEPGDPALGDPGYGYRGKTRYNFWIDGGGGSFVNLWAASGWADNGLLIENTDVPGHMYEVSIEHHQHREVVLRGVRGWELHALQTEDHIYGWESQAVELVDVHDVLFGNTVFFRVATVLGPYPYAVSVQDSTNVVLRGTRGYRPDNIANTRWGATVADVKSGRKVPELEVVYLGINESGRAASASGLSVGLEDADLAVLPGEVAHTNLVLGNDGSQPLRDVTVSAAGEGGLEVTTDAPGSSVPGGSTMTIPLTVGAPSDLEPGTSYEVELTVSVTSGGTTHELDQQLTVRVGGENLARGANVAASSTLSSNAAVNAVDGQVSGPRWVSGSSDPTPTLTVDLGDPADLDRLVLYSGVTGSEGLRVAGFEVDGMVGAQWQLMGDLSANSVSPATLSLDAPGPVSQIRIRFTHPSPSDTIARVFEVEIYGIR